MAERIGSIGNEYICTAVVDMEAATRDFELSLNEVVVDDNFDLSKAFSEFISENFGKYAATKVSKKADVIAALSIPGAGKELLG